MNRKIWVIRLIHNRYAFNYLNQQTRQCGFDIGRRFQSNAGNFIFNINTWVSGRCESRTKNAEKVSCQNAMSCHGRKSSKMGAFIYKISKKDAKKIVSCGLTKNVDKILNILEINPFQNPPPFEKLSWDLNVAYSRRLNIQHRIVYDVDSADHTVIIHRIFTHYE